MLFFFCFGQRQGRKKRVSVAVALARKRLGLICLFHILSTFIYLIIFCLEVQDPARVCMAAPLGLKSQNYTTISWQKVPIFYYSITKNCITAVLPKSQIKEHVRYSKMIKLLYLSWHEREKHQVFFCLLALFLSVFGFVLRCF